MDIVFSDEKSAITELEKGGNSYYLVAGNGIFYVNKTNFVNFTKKVDGIFGLPKVNQKVTINKDNIIKIPWNLIKKIRSFFYWVWAEYRTEAYCCIFINQEGFFDVIVPKQTCSIGNVSYKFSTGDIPPGYFKYCDVHLHPDIGTSQSEVDALDDEEDNLFHIIFNTKGKFDCYLALGKQKYPIENSLLIDIGQEEAEEFPTDWRDKVSKNKNTFISFYNDLRKSLFLWYFLLW